MTHSITLGWQKIYAHWKNENSCDVTIKHAFASPFFSPEQLNNGASFLTCSTGS